MTSPIFRSKKKCAQRGASEWSRCEENNFRWSVRDFNVSSVAARVSAWPVQMLVIFVLASCIGCGSSPDSPEVKLERARILMERDQAAEAIPLLNEVVSSVPKDAEARYQRGVAYESLDVLEKALIDYTECLLLDSDRTDALNNKAVVLAKMERFKEAAVEFTRLVDLDPQGPLAYRNRGLCYFDLGDFEKALADYAKALELAPKDASNWFQRGAVYLSQSRFEEAEQDYSKAIELDPELSMAWMNRGVARYKRGEKKLAAEDLTKAQSLDGTIVIPDINFFSVGDDSGLESQSAASNSWAAIQEFAKQDLGARGFEALTLVADFPQFQTAEYSAKKDGVSRIVIVAGVENNDTFVALPSDAASSGSDRNPANEMTLLLISTTESDPAPKVQRFAEPWNPTASAAKPVLLRYALPDGAGAMPE